VEGKRGGVGTFSWTFTKAYDSLFVCLVSVYVRWGLCSGNRVKCKLTIEGINLQRTAILHNATCNDLGSENVFRDGLDVV
jgi:hypothetical protein